ncbi:MAG: histidinol dehydrogenase [Nitrospirae bacterium RBG_16_64_22]|nr:MAG: histidinol dehydrogenase [Nitrospirae bacterium RBG_16_64_22]
MRLIEDGSRGFDREIEAIARRGSETPPDVEAAVRGILDDVRRDGDAAVARFARRFDGCIRSPGQWRVTGREIDRARRRVDAGILDALRTAAARIAAFHERQREKSWFVTDEDGALLGQAVQPLDAVGLYVPGGTASYPSSVLMNAIPARVAGVKRVVLCTPAGAGGVSPVILAAAEVAGIDEIYGIGGAQAVAAMAYGTRSVRRVEKIVGPGNLYVATAKRLVFGAVDIDMVAGPSEVLIIADESADPRIVAADLLAQAEHDPLAWPLAVSPSSDLLNGVRREAARQAATLPRKSIAAESLSRRGTLIRARSLERAVEISNRIAPEHLELAVADPFRLLPSVRNAGAVFLGHDTPEAVGDYVAGPNHVLPTGGTARFASPLSVADFVRRSSVVAFTRKALVRLGPVAVRLARAEGLEAHARSVDLRLSHSRSGRTPKAAGPAGTKRRTTR